MGASAKIVEILRGALARTELGENPSLAIAQSARALGLSRRWVGAARGSWKRSWTSDRDWVTSLRRAIAAEEAK